MQSSGDVRPARDGEVGDDRDGGDPPDRDRRLRVHRVLGADRHDVPRRSQAPDGLLLTPWGLQPAPRRRLQCDDHRPAASPQASPAATSRRTCPASRTRTVRPALPYARADPDLRRPGVCRRRLQGQGPVPHQGIRPASTSPGIRSTAMPTTAHSTRSAQTTRTEASTASAVTLQEMGDHPRHARADLRGLRRLPGLSLRLTPAITRPNTRPEGHHHHAEQNGESSASLRRCSSPSSGPFHSSRTSTPRRTTRWRTRPSWRSTSSTSSFPRVRRPTRSRRRSRSSRYRPG